MKILMLTAAFASAALVSGPVAAQSLSDARAAYMAVWEAAPLAVRKAVFVAEPATGYGTFAERENNVFASGDPLVIYLEPEGYGWASSGGLNRFGVSIDVRILTPDAQELFSQADFLELAAESGEQSTEFFGNVTLTLTDFPVGSYVLEMLLTDLASSEEASVSMPFEVQ